MTAIVKSAPRAKIATDRTVRSRGLATITIHDLLVLRDGRKYRIRGLGALNAEIHGNVCTFLERHGVPTFYIGPARNDGPFADFGFDIDVLEGLPFTIVARSHATGHHSLRYPGVKPWSCLKQIAVDFFHTCPEHGTTLMRRQLGAWIHHRDCEPLTSRSVVATWHPGDLVVAGRVIKDADLDELRDSAELAFLLLCDAWAKQKGLLTALKLSFGLDPKTGVLRVNRLLDNSCWRIWRDGEQKDDVGLRTFDNIRRITAATRAEALERTRWVAEATRRFLTN